MPAIVADGTVRMRWGAGRAPRWGEATKWQHGHFYWNELMTRDVEGAKAFYGEIAGWRFEGMAMEDGTYWVCKDGEAPVGGIMDINAARFAGVPVQWFAYVAIDDVDARVAQATAAGAELMRPLFDVPGVGRIAILKDPTGAAAWAGSHRRASSDVPVKASC